MLPMLRCWVGGWLGAGHLWGRVLGSLVCHGIAIAMFVVGVRGLVVVVVVRLVAVSAVGVVLWGFAIAPMIRCRRGLSGARRGSCRLIYTVL